MDHVAIATHLVALDVADATAHGFVPKDTIVEQAILLVALIRQSAAPIFRTQFLGENYRYLITIRTGDIAIQQTGERWSRCFYPRVGYHSKRLSLNARKFLAQLNEIC